MKPRNASATMFAQIRSKIPRIFLTFGWFCRKKGLTYRIPPPESGSVVGRGRQIAVLVSCCAFFYSNLAMLTGAWSGPSKDYND
jgi:hypothetical protein